MGPPAVARVPRAVPLFPLSYLYSGGMECDFNEAREVLHPPPVRLSLEHLVQLDPREGGAERIGEREKGKKKKKKEEEENPNARWY